MDRDEVNPQRTELLLSVDELAQTYGESVAAIYHDGVHQALPRVGEQLILHRSPLTRPADAIVNVFANNIESPTFAVGTQFVQLLFRSCPWLSVLPLAYGATRLLFISSLQGSVIIQVPVQHPACLPLGATHSDAQRQDQNRNKAGHAHVR
jgi:hypothetical protein